MGAQSYAGSASSISQPVDRPKHKRSLSRILFSTDDWFARHPYITLTLIFALVVFAPGAIECLP